MRLPTFNILNTPFVPAYKFSFGELKKAYNCFFTKIENQYIMKYLYFTFSIVLLACLIGCSSGGKKQASQQSQEPPKTEPASYKVATTQSVHLYGINTMKFVVAQKSNAIQTSGTVDVDGKTYYLVGGINTKAGHKMEVTLTTISNYPAASMSHNWLLLKSQADASTFAMASLQAKDNDYVPPGKMDLVIIETGLIAPGESKTITFTTPKQAGDYEYICTFPGHFTAGMRGTLHVK